MTRSSSGSPRSSNGSDRDGVRGYWCELAIVDGRPTAGVAIEVDGGTLPHRSCVTSRHRRTLVGCRGSPSPVSPTPTATRSTGRCGRAPRPAAARSGRGASVMYRAAQRLDPDSYHRLARATFAEMALAGITLRRRVPLPPPRPRRVALRRIPNEMGDALLAAASEAGVRITLLDTLYLHGGLDCRRLLAARRAARSASPTPMPTPGPSASTCCDRPTPSAIGAAIHSVRAVDPTSMERVVTRGGRRADPRPRVRADRRERRMCRASPPDPARAVRCGRCAVGSLHRGPRHPPGGRRRGRCSPPPDRPCAMCPTTERDLGDGIGPTDRFASSGIAVVAGVGLARGDRSLRGGPRRRTRRAPRSRRRGIHSAPELLAMATVNGHRCLGWDDAGSIAVGNRADLVPVALDSVRTAGAPPDTALEAVIFAARAGDVTDVVVDGRPVVVDGRHVHSPSRPNSAPRSPSCGPMSADRTLRRTVAGHRQHRAR